MTDTLRFSVTGLDCANCAARVETAARSLPGVTAARASLTAGTLEVDRAPGGPTPQALAEAVAATGHDLAPLGAPRDPAYARILAWVVALNLGYGVFEIAAGLIAGSQALLADSLDFIGDGLISGLALAALGWTARTRAQTALAQGVFLAAMGLAVLAGTLGEAFRPELPQSALMGAVGAGALAVNLLCALLMMRHRGGDASARAVWLFSRNDALGNLAVVAAAGLVAALNSPWPDIVIAAAIAALFLASSAAILRDARRELAA
ncbi:cation transporter [Rhodobacter sp. Har01]|uniref:cation transporter n=1 Tax=Rhodobacter sp. Har01 TaxID=2883999 RepID=UPI001D0750F0|nr:cation transporter [Rhodobacter sp. Har01]MCB6178505.1 cation transporter [Rhodobacter sp. Har01]